MRNPLWSDEHDDMEAEDEILAEAELVDPNLYLCGLLNQVLDRACAATGLPPEFFTAARQ